MASSLSIRSRSEHPPSVDAPGLFELIHRVLRPPKRGSGSQANDARRLLDLIGGAEGLARSSAAELARVATFAETRAGP